jgi:hypothetical protein
MHYVMWCHLAGTTLSHVCSQPNFRTCSTHLWALKPLHSSHCCITSVFSAGSCILFIAPFLSPYVFLTTLFLSVYNPCFYVKLIEHVSYLNKTFENIAVYRPQKKYSGKWAVWFHFINSIKETFWIFLSSQLFVFLNSTFPQTVVELLQWAHRLTLFIKTLLKELWKMIYLTQVTYRGLQFFTVNFKGFWTIMLQPDTFECHVCRLL